MSGWPCIFLLIQNIIPGWHYTWICLHLQQRISTINVIKNCFWHTWLRVGNSLFRSYAICDLLRSLMTKRRWENHSGRSCHSQKQVIPSKKLKKIIFSKGFCSFPPFKAKNQIAPVALRSVAVSFLKSDREQIPQVALNKRATVSNLLRLLITKERPWAIRSCHSLKKSNWAIGSKKNEQITLSLFRSK